MALNDPMKSNEIPIFEIWLFKIIQNKLKENETILYVSNYQCIIFFNLEMTNSMFHQQVPDDCLLTNLIKHTPLKSLKF